VPLGFLFNLFDIGVIYGLCSCPYVSSVIQETFFIRIIENAVDAFSLETLEEKIHFLIRINPSFEDAL